MRKVFLLMLVSFFVFGCQPISLEGEVLDEKMDPLPSTKILVKRSKKIYMETDTDDAGRFSLTNLHLEDSILFVKEGYRPGCEKLHPDLIRYPWLTIILENH